MCEMKASMLYVQKLSRSLMKLPPPTSMPVCTPVDVWWGSMWIELGVQKVQAGRVRLYDLAPALTAVVKLTDLRVLAETRVLRVQLCLHARPVVVDAERRRRPDAFDRLHLAPEALGKHAVLELQQRVDVLHAHLIERGSEVGWLVVRPRTVRLGRQRPAQRRPELGVEARILRAGRQLRRRVVGRAVLEPRAGVGRLSGHRERWEGGRLARLLGAAAVGMERATALDREPAGLTQQCAHSGVASQALEAEHPCRERRHTAEAVRQRGPGFEPGRDLLVRRLLDHDALGAHHE